MELWPGGTHVYTYTPASAVSIFAEAERKLPAHLAFVAREMHSRRGYETSCVPIAQRKQRSLDIEREIAFSNGEVRARPTNSANCHNVASRGTYSGSL